MVIDGEHIPPEELESPESAEDVEPQVQRSGPPEPGLLVIVLAVVMVLSLVAVFLGVFAFGLSGLQEQRNQHQLYAELRGLLDPSSPIAPKIGGQIPNGWPVALLNAPAAGMHNVVVVEGTSSGELLNGPGHLANTPLPGQVGESILIGKRVTAGAPFAGITRLRRGDLITVRTGQGPFRFRVEGRLVAGGPRPKIAHNGGLLTLVTSNGPGFLGQLAPDSLVYVDAKLVSKPVATPKHQPKTVQPLEIQGHNDPAAWPFVALWSLAISATTVIWWMLWRRWGILQAWIVAAPVMFAVLWGFSTEAMRLLPNAY
jgi:sortase A